MDSSTLRGGFVNCRDGYGQCGSACDVVLFPEELDQGRETPAEDKETNILVSSMIWKPKHDREF